MASSLAGLKIGRERALAHRTVWGGIPTRPLSNIHHANNSQAPLQLNSLTGTYATSTYLAALKKSSKDLEALAKDIESFDAKIKSDKAIAAMIGEPSLPNQTSWAYN